jgi:two-component system, OmpR family, phosphate regulon sensor histidine kinase PhoR
MNNSSLNQCENILNVSSNGVIIFDLNQTVIYSNPAAIKFTKLPSGGYHIDEIFKIFPNADFKKQLPNVLEKKEIINIPEIFSGDFYYEIFIVPMIENDQVTGGSIILHDISYIKRLEEIKTKFLTVAAHQLRTPLGGMRWSLEMILEDETCTSPEAKNLLNQVYQSNLMALTIVNDLLNVSKIENQQEGDNPEPTNVVRIIQKVLSNHQAEAKMRSVNYKVNLPPAESFPAILIDKLKIREIIENLIANAIKYNKPNGSLSITITHDEQTLSLSIADTGIGIPEKDLKRIFTKFFRAGNAVLNETSGSGLGLFVVKNYIEKWGGKISINSKENVGTTVNISLPMKLAKTKDSEETISQKPQTEIPVPALTQTDPQPTT